MPSADADSQAASRRQNRLVSFEEVANQALGWAPSSDDVEFLSISDISKRLEAAYSEDLNRFEAIASRAQAQEAFVFDLQNGLNTFSSTLSKMLHFPRNSLAKLLYVPLDPTVLKLRPLCNPYKALCSAYEAAHGFNEPRGLALLQFLLAHSMERNPRFVRLHRGLRATIVTYARRMEAIFSIWDSSGFGPVFAIPGASLRQDAYLRAMCRLLDALLAASGFDVTYAFFERHLSPLHRMPRQFLYNVLISDPKDRPSGVHTTIPWLPPAIRD